LSTQCAVLESKGDMQKRGQATPDAGDALALTFAQPVKELLAIVNYRRALL
jgi:hypothetical protein